MNIDTRDRLETRSKQLIKSIELINGYDPYLREKYYTVMLHSISLLLQYTIILKED